MKILSMTATFGKLRNQTLILKPDLNIIEAPNEWGKSTWCAFVMAMLYGIDTGSRSKTGFLADKEHYAPWSGEPMSGRMNILWQGKEITLQRNNKGRTPLGEVKAFETHTGIPVPELEIAAPGQVLLGVERSVFARAGFVKLSDMPVTEDESLRRRLNELVTTGDESGASDDLAQKLKDLKNRCRFNKKGILPELEAQQAELSRKLQQMAALKEQIATVSLQESGLQQQMRVLENHKQALQYEVQQEYNRKIAEAQATCDEAEQALQQLEVTCQDLPSQEQLRQNLADLQTHRQMRDAMITRIQQLPPAPPAPQIPEPFRGKEPQTAIEEAEQDFQALTSLAGKQKQSLWMIFGSAGILLGGVLAYFILYAGIPVAVAGLAAAIVGFVKKGQAKKQIAAICARYQGIPADRWESAAAEYARTQKTYTDAVNARQQEQTEINHQLYESNDVIAQITGGEGIARFEEICRENLQKHEQLQTYTRRYQQAQEILQAYSGTAKDVAPPEFEDTLDISQEETERRLADSSVQYQLLRQRLGQCEGQMEALGQEEALQAQFSQIQTRIARLEQYYRALTRAQEALVEATQELQRRFAPRISRQARDLFARMTQQRYDKLILTHDLDVETGTADEPTQWSSLWRSDGTVDQLYLSLRLAVAKELTPDAPLVLDDAMVRFDDGRLRETLNILQEEAAEKQVILFTCQDRENRIIREENQ